METYGKVWQHKASYGNLWQYMTTYVSQWQSLAVSGGQWQLKFLSIHSQYQPERRRIE